MKHTDCIGTGDRNTEQVAYAIFVYRSSMIVYPIAILIWLVIMIKTYTFTKLNFIMMVTGLMITSQCFGLIANSLDSY